MTETKLSLLPDPPAQGVPSAYFGYAGWVTEMKHYFRTLWIAICGDEGFVYVRNTHLEGLEARIEKYERRAKGQRDANEKRKAAISTTGATQ